MSFLTDDPNANSNEENLTGLFSEFANDNDSDLTFTDVFTEELAYVLNIYFTPALVFLGTIGNLLSIIVFFKSKLRAQSTSQYLTALAVSDTIFLLQLIPPWLKAVRVSRVFAREGFCQSFVYLTYVSSSSSSWLVVSFTIERFVAVLYPLRRTRMCTVRRARLLILGIAFSCIAINTPVLMFAVPKGNDCNIDYDLMDHAARFNVVDTIFSFTLPLTIITVLNIWIMIGVCRLSRARGHLIKEEEVQPRVGHGRRRRRQTRARPESALPRRGTRSSLQRSQQRITRMLLIVSSVFVLLNLPAYSMRIVAYANNMSSYEYSGRWAALQQICLLFFNSNFGINFFLYCMTGQNFRRALCQTFPCLARLRAALKRFFYCWAEEHAQLPHPSSITNSLSINTDAPAYAAASRVNLRHNTGASSRCTDVACGTFLELWRFDNSRRQLQTRVHEQVYPVQSHWFTSSQVARPVPRWPENALGTNHPEFADNPAPLDRMTSLTFQPVRYDLKPGQVAPGHLTGFESPSLPISTRKSPRPAKAYRYPLLPGILERFGPRTCEPALDRYVSPFEHPQPPRKFSLPARQLHELERANTPPEWVDVPPPRGYWQSPVASAASSPAGELESEPPRSLLPHTRATPPDAPPAAPPVS